MKMLFCLIFFFVFQLCFSSPIIKIENGKIEGETFDNYYAFKNIPYAFTEKRFSPSKPYNEKWDDVREFKKMGSECAQYEHFSYAFTGIEDCLSLNVYVPKSVLESEEQVPVIFFIHGGAFMFGGSWFYGPENIMEFGKMILVTINYRLGILGFLSTEDDIIPGNFGLKDQVEALKWVNKNIYAFNGNKNEVTLVGFSAGGASVHLHYMSPLSKGLFKNGISISGAATNPWVITENAREKAHMVAKHAGCADHSTMLECLREIPVEKLTMISKHFQPFMYNPFTPFGPCLEAKHKSAFITENPKKILANGNYQKLPWLLVLVKDEGLYPTAEFYRDENILQKIDERWDDLAPYLLDFYGQSRDENILKDVSKQIRHFYLGNKKISRKTFQEFNDIFTDRLFKADAFDAIKMQSKSYMMHYQYKSLYGLAQYTANTTNNLGVAHGEDIVLLFKTVLREIPYSKEEKLMTHNLLNMWYQFAKDNKPIFNDLEMEETSSSQVKCLNVLSPNEYEMIDLNDFGMASFWHKIEKILSSSSSIKYEL